jgi:DNA primase
MSTTHIGKIGRLPKSIRDELGHRIEDGEQGKELVKWLNCEPDVLEVLQEQFGGRAITEQNLSEWKQTGHPEWLRQEEIRSLVSQLTERAEDLGEASDGQEISDLFASLLAAELTQLAAALLEKETDPEKRWQRLREVHRELSQLRRDDHRAVRTMIKRDRWQRETEREEDEEYQRVKQANKSRLTDMCLSPMHNKVMAECFGGGEYGEKMAEMLHRIKFDLPLDDLINTKLPGKTCPNGIQPNPTESDSIQPNPTK